MSRNYLSRYPILFLDYHPCLGANLQRYYSFTWIKGSDHQGHLRVGTGKVGSARRGFFFLLVPALHAEKTWRKNPSPNAPPIPHRGLSTSAKFLLSFLNCAPQCTRRKKNPRRLQIPGLRKVTASEDEPRHRKQGYTLADVVGRLSFSLFWMALNALMPSGMQ